MSKRKKHGRLREKKKDRLTQSVSCAGLASKLSPALLRQAVFNLKQPYQPNLLVGFDKADDAGVYLINPDMALIQTVDFFTPIVDDPYWYGMIAAANSLSDVYAMGGTPLTALNILCYPEELGSGPMRKILRGGLDKMIEAGCTLVGGHWVNDPSLKYGLSVTGLIHPKRVFSNAMAQPGQILALTKPLGTGIVVTAAKFDGCPKRLLKKTMGSMATLNKFACDAMIATGATACTDITGFGFLGHLSEMVRASKVAVNIFLEHLPYDPEISTLVKDGYITGAEKKNREYAGKINLNHVDKVLQSILFDPQTSGGLLVSMPREDFSVFQDRLRDANQDAWIVGEITGTDLKGRVTVS